MLHTTKELGEFSASVATCFTTTSNKRSEPLQVTDLKRVKVDESGLLLFVVSTYLNAPLFNFNNNSTAIITMKLL